MSFNTPSQLTNYIGLRIADFSDGEARFQRALDEANAEVLFRLGVFDDSSYPERSPFGAAKKGYADILAATAEWMRAGVILYNHKAQIELQYGQSGTPTTTPDGFNIGAFTPEKNTQSDTYRKRAEELQEAYEKVMATIEPRTNYPYQSSVAGRSDYSDDGTYFGSADAWA